MFKDGSFKISIYLKHSNEIIQGVVSGKYDIGFSHHRSNYSKFTSKLLYTDELLFVGTEDIPEFKSGIHFSQLEDLRVFHSNLFDNYIDDLLHDSNSYDFSIDISSRIIPLLKSHKAFAFMPKKYVQDIIDNNALFTYSILDYNLPPLEHYIIYPKDFDKEEHPKKDFVDSIRAYSKD